MSVEIPRVDRDFNDRLQTVGFTELPWMLYIAEDWINQRPTMGSVAKAIKNGFYKKYPESGHKTDFLVSYDYLRNAVEEAGEFKIARPTEKVGELGDVLFYLLHFANRAGILPDDVVPHISTDNFDRQISLILPTKTMLVDSFLERQHITSVVKWFAGSIRRDNINLLGAMSFDDGPWTLDRNSTDWLSYQQSITSRWSIVFSTICRYAVQNDFSLLDTINKTIIKVDHNFPTSFFVPKLTPFISGPSTVNYGSECCRLFRKVDTDSGVSLIDEYHSLFNAENIVKDPKFFRQWIHDALVSILTNPKLKDGKQKAEWLLKNFKWESFD